MSPALLTSHRPVSKSKQLAVKRMSWPTNVPVRYRPQWCSKTDQETSSRATFTLGALVLSCSVPSQDRSPIQNVSVVAHAPVTMHSLSLAYRLGMEHSSCTKVRDYHFQTEELSESHSWTSTSDNSWSPKTAIVYSVEVLNEVRWG